MQKTFENFDWDGLLARLPVKRQLKIEIKEKRYGELLI